MKRVLRGCAAVFGIIFLFVVLAIGFSIVYKPDPMASQPREGSACAAVDIFLKEDLQAWGVKRYKIQPCRERDVSYSDVSGLWYVGGTVTVGTQTSRFAAQVQHDAVNRRWVLKDYAPPRIKPRQ